MKEQLQQFTAEIGQHFFLREYSFAENVFKPHVQTEVEAADHLIALPDAFLVFQVKERDRGAANDPLSIERWFKKKVLDVGCGQLADSIRYLKAPNLVLKNQRGHAHRLSGEGRPVVPILLYASGTTLPASVGCNTHKVSRRAGFVHIMDIRDYLYLCKTLALPSELVAYFDFRKTLLGSGTTYPWSEPRITAQFIRDTFAPLADEEVSTTLQAAVDDTLSFDISGILSRLGDKVTYLDHAGSDFDYYRILAAFSRLNRSEMRGFKRMFSWTLEKARASSFEIPVRMHSLNTGTGFVLFPVPTNAFEKRLKALHNYTGAAKYDWKLERQIGLCVARDGTEIEIDWEFLEYPWERDPELDEVLAKRYPFRTTPEPQLEYRYPASSDKSS